MFWSDADDVDECKGKNLEPVDEIVFVRQDADGEDPESRMQSRSDSLSSRFTRLFQCSTDMFFRYKRI